MVHTPFQRIETRNYLANGAGGFDVRDCPDAIELATFINRACNSHDDLLEALKQVMDWIRSWDPNFTQDDDWPETEHHVRAAISKAEGGE